MAPRNKEAEEDLAPTEDTILKSKDYAAHAHERHPTKLLWSRVIIYTLMHLGALYGATLIPVASPFTWIWCVFLHIFGSLGATAGAHRLWSHRCYKAKMPLRILLGVMHSTSFQMRIYDWARDHRVHHKYSDTDADPHNASRGFFFSHIGWLLCRKHPDVIARGRQNDLSDLENDPVVAFQRRHVYLLGLTCCYLMPTLVPWLGWGESPLTALFLAGQLRVMLGWHAIWSINSAAHAWGMKPYDVRIRSTENMIASVSCIGEGFHNYHHTFPQDYAASEFGWKLNITTAFIDTMAFLGQAYDLKKVSKEVVDQRRRRTGDKRA